MGAGSWSAFSSTRFLANVMIKSIKSILWRFCKGWQLGRIQLGERFLNRDTCAWYQLLILDKRVDFTVGFGHVPLFLETDNANNCRSLITWSYKINLKGCKILENAVKWRSTYNTSHMRGWTTANRPENRCKSSADIWPLSSRLPTIPSADCSKEFQSSKLDASTSSCGQPSQATYRRHNEWSYFGPRSHNSTPSLSAPRSNPSAGYKTSWISIFLSHRKPTYQAYRNLLARQEVCSGWFDCHCGKDKRTL